MQDHFKYILPDDDPTAIEACGSWKFIGYFKSRLEWIVVTG